MKKKHNKSKQNAVGAVFSAIAVLLIIALLVGGLAMITNGFKEWNPDKWFNKPSVEQTPNGVEDGNGNVLDSDKVYEMPVSMAFTRANSSVTLQATVKPDNATNKKVKWSVSWKNASSTWANGKNVSDYISLSSTTDNPTTITCKQAFGEQIIITVVSEVNSDAKATCKVDFKQKVTGINDFLSIYPSDNSQMIDGLPIEMQKDNINVIPAFIYDEKDGITFIPDYAQLIDASFLYDCSLDADSTYTIMCDSSISVSFELSDDAYGLFKSYFGKYGGSEYVSQKSIDLLNTEGVFFNEKFFSYLAYGNKQSDLSSSDYKCLMDICSFLELDGTRHEFGAIVLECEGYSNRYPVFFEASSFGIFPSSIEINNGGIVF